MAKDITEQEPAGAVGWVQGTRTYFEESFAELRKVTFPQRKEAVAGTIGVLVIVAVVTLVLGLADLVLSWGVGAVLP